MLQYLFFYKFLQTIYRRENNKYLQHVSISSLCFPNTVCPHFLTNHSTKAGLLMVEGLLICLESMHLSQKKIPLCVLHTVGQFEGLKLV